MLQFVRCSFVVRVADFREVAPQFCVLVRGEECRSLSLTRCHFCIFIRLYFRYKENKHIEFYNTEAKEKLDRLNKQMAIQLANVHETLDVIHNDYNRMVNKMKYDDYEKGGPIKAEMDRSLNFSKSDIVLSIKKLVFA